MHAMKRRTALQWIVSLATAAVALPVRLFGQPRELTAEAVSLLHEIAASVLPSSLGAAGTRAVVDRFVGWTREYREGVALAHGYGHPRLQKSGPSPVPAYIAQLTAIASEARARGGAWSSLDSETRRSILDAAFVKAGVRNLPPRPAGQHIVADLMAFYFRGSEANDLCYNALINREICRPIEITTRKPASLAASASGQRRGQEYRPVES
jgi:hypothetical protein